MNAQATCADTLLQKFKDEATNQHAVLIKSISNQIAGLRTHQRNRDHKTWEEMDDDMPDDIQTEHTMDTSTADGSHNPHMSHVSHPTHGMDASAIEKI